MKKLLPLLLLLGAAAILTAQSPGDLAFTGFNADGDDDFALVAFVELAPNTTLFFRDEEWNGTAFGAGEGSMIWNTGTAAIPAGTVISFNNTSTPGATVSIGRLTNPDIALSASGDGLFVYLGTDVSTPIVFLAAIGNASVATAFGTLDGTGLQEGATAITLPTGTDIADYRGPRSGLTVNGYLLALNDNTNYVVQDGSGDQHNDGVEPDLPFDATPFELGADDVTPPAVTRVRVVDANTLAIVFSEPVDTAAGGANSTVNPANYSLAPALAVTAVAYDPALRTARLTHAGFTEGVGYTLSVSNIADTTGNVQAQPFVSGLLYFNAGTPRLVITEIMYNPPADSLEFVEIYNAGDSPATLGGLVLRDVGGSGLTDEFEFVFPAMTLAPGGFVLLASNPAGAGAFFGQTFMDLPGDANVLGNGGETLELYNSAGAVIDAVTYDDAAPWPTAPDGNGPSLELLNPDFDNNVAASWTASDIDAGMVGDIVVFASPGDITIVNRPTVSFAADYSTAFENDGTVTIPVTVTNSGDQAGSVLVSVVAGNAAADTDYVLTTTRLAIPASAGTDTILLLAVGLNDNDAANNAKWLALSLTEPVNAFIGSIDQHVLYVLDDDTEPLLPDESLRLELLTSYLVREGGSAEIVAHDPVTQRLFVVNSTNTELAILDFSDPANIKQISVIDMTAYGSGLTSVAVQDGLVAAAVAGNDFADGSVIFLDTDGNVLKTVTVGNLPDHVGFSPDGRTVITANEGQPNDDYTIDPEGSISLIDLSDGIAALTQDDVTTLNFNAYNGDAAALRALGIRIYGPGASVSQDLEPEYAAFSADGSTAYVTLQENNALAVVDLSAPAISAILPLGYKDHRLPQNAFDASDRTDTIIFANWPVFGMYQPDGIAYFEVEGQGYLITANEGDAREYDALEEEVSVGDADYMLDTAVFPDADILKRNTVLGRLAVVNTLGDTDGDGDFDQIYTLGGRSFSIWNATDGALVFDSGDQLERLTAADPVYGSLFNASNSNNTYKNRSDNKGPEPESVVTAVIGGTPYAFIALERTGGVVVYDLRDPAAPVFAEYVNSRTLGDDEGGDLGPEGIIYLSPQVSPIDTGLIVVANEISATISVFKIV